ncbi:MAG: SpoIIE family protein phosphatase [Prevotella sp.]|nr:SpoIIE family protein phosphatase [Prevotella sp.]
MLDLPTGRLRYCNAGHDIPVVIDGESVTPLPVKSNLPVGLFDDFHFELQEATIAKDATLFLYTDGLSEARNNSHKQFSEKRIMKVLNLSRHDSPKDIIQKMAQEVRQFVGEEEQSDDLTMLAFRYSPITADYIQHGEVTLKNDISQLDNLHNFLKSVAEKIHMDTSTTRNIRLAVEEAVVNIMDYAYPAGTEGIINVKAMSDTKCLKLVITDYGAAFNPTEAARADTSLSAEDRPIGGLGIFLVRELMDSINYERSEGKNILTLKKKIPFNTSKENHPGN